MIVKTSELEGAALDWAVCMAAHGKDSREVWSHPSDDPGDPYPVKGGYRPSTDWAQGGPLIERYDIDIEDDMAMLGDYENTVCKHGETKLIAAMRTIVAAELGDEVDVPEELV